MADVPSLDRSIADAVLAGDGDAYRLLVERATDSVFATCLRVVRDPDEAADVTQDAFVQAYRMLPTWRGEGPFAAWVRRIAMRMAFARIRARRTLPFPDLDRDDAGPAAETAQEPEHLALSRENRSELVALIAGLPEAYRRVVALRFSDELSIEEIAHATGAPEGTVKSRLHRAIAQLRRQLDEGQVA